MVYVDELRDWPAGKMRPRCFKEGSCHLTADTLEELHEFAAKIGMRRSWFQPHPMHPHYDLTASRRARALRMGAVFVPAKKQAKKRLEQRGILP